MKIMKIIKIILKIIDFIFIVLPLLCLYLFWWAFVSIYLSFVEKKNIFDIFYEFEEEPTLLRIVKHLHPKCKCEEWEVFEDSVEKCINCGKYKDINI